MFVYKLSGCGFESRCNGAVVCRLTFFVLGIIKFIDKYGRWKNAVEGKGVRVNVDKTKDICSYYLERKVVFQRSILVVYVVSRLRWV